MGKNGPKVSTLRSYRKLSIPPRTVGCGLGLVKVRALLPVRGLDRREDRQLHRSDSRQDRYRLTGSGYQAWRVFSNAELSLPRTVSMAPVSAPPTLPPQPAPAPRPITVVVQNQLPAESVNGYMQGQVIETVSHTHAGQQAVSDAQLSANCASMNRQTLQAAIVAPGIVRG